jgi:hypothetical protein
MYIYNSCKVHHSNTEKHYFKQTHRFKQNTKRHLAKQTLQKSRYERHQPQNSPHRTRHANHTMQTTCFDLLDKSLYKLICKMQDVDTKLEKKQQKRRHTITQKDMRLINQIFITHDVFMSLVGSWHDYVTAPIGSRFHAQVLACDTSTKDYNKAAMLYTLQIAACRGFIVPHEFDLETECFFEWTGFHVVPEHNGDFYKSVLNLTQAKGVHIDRAMHSLMTSCGWAPATLGQWNDAWLGISCFRVVRQKTVLKVE